MLVVRCMISYPPCLTLQQALDKTPRFLGRFELDRGAPLHISATAAVLAADEVLRSGSKRRVALKLMCQPAQVANELVGRLDLDPKYVVSILSVLLDADHADAEPLRGYDGPLSKQLATHEGLAADLQQLVRERRPDRVKRTGVQQPLRGGVRG